MKEDKIIQQLKDEVKLSSWHCFCFFHFYKAVFPVCFALLCSEMLGGNWGMRENTLIKLFRHTGWDIVTVIRMESFLLQ